ncbi:Hypothetical predicted protein [Lecanosticta acicola]|uniref:Uncharacterized protein n=1 Tax=Lecanosticta acicola TaxID=111012 RepID=A0AAI8W2F8_9PEZI|nr:Hypothetical predicted protein [Lecanosticta acicola]
MDSLTERIQALPAEIFDESKALTFTADAEELIEITPGYMSPAQLQVNHATTESFANEYYTSVPFLITKENETFGIK